MSTLRFVLRIRLMSNRRPGYLQYHLCQRRRRRRHSSLRIPKRPIMLL